MDSLTCPINQGARRKDGYCSVGSIFGNVIDKLSNRRYKKRASSHIKKRKNGFQKRIMKIVERAPDHFFTIDKMSRLLKVQDHQIVCVRTDVGKLFNEFKLVWRKGRQDFGLGARWLPIDLIREFILDYLAPGRQRCALDLWNGLQSANLYMSSTFEFNIAYFLEVMITAGHVQMKQDNHGVRYYYLTPDQFFERQKLCVS